MVVVRMQLFPAMAQKIVKEVSNVITEQIIVVDKSGTIIASSDESRIGNFHEGAMKALKQEKMIYINTEQAKLMKNVKPGINMPLYFDNIPIGVIGITGEPERVKSYAELIRRMTELLVKEAYHSEQLRSQARGLESFIYEWVNLDTIKDEFIERGEILGIKMTTPYLITMFQLDIQTQNPNIQMVEREMLEWFHRNFSMTKQDFLVNWGQGRFVLLKSIDQVFNRSYFTQQLTRWKNYFEETFSVRFSIGVGKTIQSKTIGKSYLEAKKALKASEKKNSIVFYEDLILELLLQEISLDAKKEFLSKTLMPILEDDELKETLKIYLLENQSMKKTAQRMHIHKNTLHYRLKQIKEKTGIDPKNTEGIVLFYLGLAFQSDDV